MCARANQSPYTNTLNIILNIPEARKTTSQASQGADRLRDFLATRDDPVEDCRQEADKNFDTPNETELVAVQQEPPTCKL